MSLGLNLDRASPTPYYRQVADQIRDRIRDGHLNAGERLPTVRALAEHLHTTRLTVHKAFRDLQSSGWLEATVGRGTFVRGTRHDAAGTPLPTRNLSADRVMADIHDHGHRSDVINMAHSEPDPSLIPADAFWDCLESLRSDASAHVQYISPQGDPLLREGLAELMKDRGVETSADGILVTSGVTQGLSLVTQALARHGDVVAVEQPTYLGLLHILEAHGVRPAGIPLDNEGPRLDVLERVIIQERPRFFYTIATFHNPTGKSMTARRRRDLLSLAERHGLIIVEDDIYHRLAYEKPAPPTLKSMDRRGLVIYLDGLSKAILPGVRSGFAVAPQPLLDRMLSLRRAADLCGPSTIHRALAEFLSRGMVDKHIRKILPEYKRRRDTVLAALKKTMPVGVTWTRPEGGFCLWVTLPDHLSGADLYGDTLDRGVIFAPGEVFLAGDDSRSARAHLRICFGRHGTKELKEGVAILADAIRRGAGPRTSRRRTVPDHAPLV